MRLLLTISLVFFAVAGRAQDLLLTQFDRVNALVNPALVGDIDGNYSVHTHYRNQWPGIGEAYTSTLISGEARFFEGDYSPSFLGVGLVLVNDKAGNSALTTRSVRGSISYNLSPNDYNQLAFGLQGAYVHRTISYEGLAWDSQYNGTGYDPSLDSQENFAGATRGVVDLAAGISWAHEKKRSYRVSYGVYHMMQDRSLLASGKDAYAFRHTLRWDLKKQYRKALVRYMAMGSAHAGARTVSFGAVGTYQFGSNSRYTTFRTSSLLMAGLYYRYGDALTPVVGGRLKEYAEVLIGYDITLSNLNKVNRYRGGWEISLRYTGAFDEQRRKLK